MTTLQITTRFVPLSLINPNVSKIRSSHDVEELRALAASVKEIGVLEPVLLRPAEGGRYDVIAGDRRCMAASMVGLAAIEARVADTFGFVETAAENLGRRDLTPIEEARAYRRLVEHESLDVEEIAARVGKPASHVHARLRLAYLDDTTLSLLDSGRLEYRGAAFLAGVHADVRARVVEQLARGRGPIEMSTLRDEVENASVDLSDAPFETTDASLVDEAGACGACSKNTAVQRDLFGARDAICLDVPCFARKSGVAAMRARDKVIEAGGNVAEGLEAERLTGSSSGFVALSTLCHEWARANPGKLVDGRIPTWGDVLRESGHSDVAVTVAIVTDHLGVSRVVQLMRERDKARVLGNVDVRAREEVESDQATDDPVKRAAAEKREKRRVEVEEIVLRRLCEVVAEPAIATTKAIELVALGLIDAMPSRVCEAVALRRELVAKKSATADYAHVLSTAVRRDASLAAGVALELMLVKGRDDVGSKAATLVGDMLAELEIDVSSVRGEVKRDLDKRDEVEAAKRGEGRVRKRRPRKSEQTELVSEAPAGAQEGAEA